jgi:hypothetical protein
MKPNFFRIYKQKLCMEFWKALQNLIIKASLIIFTQTVIQRECSMQAARHEELNVCTRYRGWQ